MRVAIVADFAGQVRGGIEFHAGRLAALFERLGHDATIFPRARLRSLALKDHDGLVVEGVFRPTLLRLAASAGFSRVPKVLFTHGSFYEEAHGAEMHACGVPTSPSTWFLRPILNRVVVRPIFNKFDAIFTLCARETADLCCALGTDPGNVTDLPQAGIPRAVPPRSSPDGARWSRFAPYIVAVGRVHQRKNFLAAVQAVEGTNVTFILAGQDGGDLRRVLSYVRRRGVRNFQYLGEVDDPTKTQLVLGSLAGVLPSRFEGIPYSALECLALGKPCIVTEFSYLERRPGLILCPPRPTDLRRAILRILGEPSFPEPPSDQAGDEDVARQVIARLSRGPRNN